MEFDELSKSGLIKHPDILKLEKELTETHSKDKLTRMTNILGNLTEKFQVYIDVENQNDNLEFKITPKDIKPEMPLGLLSSTFILHCYFYLKMEGGLFVSPTFIFNISNAFPGSKRVEGMYKNYGVDTYEPEIKMDPELLEQTKDLIKTFNRFSFLKLLNAQNEEINVIKLILDLLRAEHVDIDLLRAFVEIPEIAAQDLNKLCKVISNSKEYSTEALSIACELFECR